MPTNTSIFVYNKIWFPGCHVIDIEVNSWFLFIFLIDLTTSHHDNMYIPQNYVYNEIENENEAKRQQAENSQTTNKILDPS